MATTALQVAKQVVGLLMDATSVGWTAQELVQYINAGQREMAIQRPDLFGQQTVLTLAAGTRQTLPATAYQLLDVLYNTSSKTAVRMIQRRAMDELDPEWHNHTQSATVRHYMYDVRDPDTFFVYPPAIAATQLTALAATYPTEIAEPADGLTWTAITGTLSIPDLFASALIDYVLYRAYSKDSEYSGDAGRAVAHYTAFTGALGAQSKALTSTAPGTNRPGEPAAA